MMGWSSDTAAGLDDQGSVSGCCSGNLNLRRRSVVGVGHQSTAHADSRLPGSKSRRPRLSPVRELRTIGRLPHSGKVAAMQNNRSCSTGLFFSVGWGAKNADSEQFLRVGCRVAGKALLKVVCRD